jgi:hypothetical protein
MFLSPILDRVNLRIRENQKTVFKPRFLFSELVATTLSRSVPKMSESLLNAMEGLTSKVDYSEYTIEIDGEEVPVQKIYAGASLEALLIKSNIQSKSPIIQHAINRIATIWLYYCANDSFFAMQELGKKTFNEKIFNMFLNHSVDTQMYG